MTFQNVDIRLDESIVDNTYRQDFNLRLNFIAAYLSIDIRKYKHVSDVSGLVIYVGGNIFEKDERLPIYRCSIPFNKMEYEHAARTGDLSYYCQLIRSGLVASEGNYRIPVEDLLEILEKFEKGNYVHTWNYKSKVFKNHDLRAKFVCNYTTDAFTLDAYFYQKSTKRELCHGTLFRTLPDSAFFTKAFKEIVEEDDYIAVTEYTDRYNLVYISIDQIFQGKFNFKFNDGRSLESWEVEGLDYLKKKLTFEGNSFYYGVSFFDTDEFDEAEDESDNLNRNI